MPPELPEPWRGFLTDLDNLVTHDVQLHCCGGFVVTVLYGLASTTAETPTPPAPTPEQPGEQGDRTVR